MAQDEAYDRGNEGSGLGPVSASRRSLRMALSTDDQSISFKDASASSKLDVPAISLSPSFDFEGREKSTDPHSSNNATNDFNISGKSGRVKHIGSTVINQQLASSSSPSPRHSLYNSPRFSAPNEDNTSSPDSQKIRISDLNSINAAQSYSPIDVGHRSVEHPLDLSTTERHAHNFIDSGSSTRLNITGESHTDPIPILDHPTTLPTPSLTASLTSNNHAPLQSTVDTSHKEGHNYDDYEVSYVDSNNIDTLYNAHDQPDEQYVTLVDDVQRQGIFYSKFEEDPPLATTINKDNDDDWDYPNYDDDEDEGRAGVAEGGPGDGHNSSIQQQHGRGDGEEEDEGQNYDEYYDEEFEDDVDIEHLLNDKDQHDSGPTHNTSPTHRSAVPSPTHATLTPISAATPPPALKFSDFLRSKGLSPRVTPRSADTKDDGNESVGFGRAQVTSSSTNDAATAVGNEREGVKQDHGAYGADLHADFSATTDHDDTSTAPSASITTAAPTPDVSKLTSEPANERDSQSHIGISLPTLPTLSSTTHTDDVKHSISINNNNNNNNTTFHSPIIATTTSDVAESQTNNGLSAK